MGAPTETRPARARPPPRHPSVGPSPGCSPSHHGLALGRQGADPKQGVLQGAYIRRRCAPIAVEQRERGERSDHLVRRDVRDRRAGGDVVEQLRGRASPRRTPRSVRRRRASRPRASPRPPPSPGRGTPRATPRVRASGVRAPTRGRRPPPGPGPSTTPPTSVLWSGPTTLRTSGRSSSDARSPASSGVRAIRVATIGIITRAQPRPRPARASRGRARARWR